MSKVFTIADKPEDTVVFSLSMEDGKVTLNANGVKLLYIAKDSDVVLYNSTKEGREQSGLEFADSGTLNVYVHGRV